LLVPNVIGETRNAWLTTWDLDLLVYPWGDTRLRPYFVFGMGVANEHFDDRLMLEHKLLALAVPVGIGAKYIWTDRLAVRVEFADDVAIGANQIQTLQDLSLTFGLELRFGGARHVYWPWTAGKEYW
jgi:hypothetical protein